MKRYAGMILFLITGFVSAQTRSTFDHLTVEDGLANNSVRSIFQDMEGYLWFGTLNGLSRYDGQQFRTFVHQPGDLTSISNNKIREIFQDGLGYLWITTYDDDIHRFDPRTETFVNFPMALDGQQGGSAMNFMCESSPGVVWLYMTGKGCVRIISATDSPSYTADWFNTGNALPANELNMIRAGSNGGVWIATEAGICFLPDDRLPVKELYRAKQFLCEPRFNVVYMFVAEKALWAGCMNGEVFKLTGPQEELVWKAPEAAGENRRISFIDSTHNGDMCIGSRNGLLFINKDSGKHTHFTNSNSELNTSYISSFFHDRHGDFWLITDGRGVTRFRPQTKEFTHYPLRPEIRQSILEGEKQIFREDINGDLWLAIYGGGVSRFNRQTGLFEQFLHDGNNQGSLSSNLVLSIFEDQSGNLWVGTYKRGLNKINLQHYDFHFLKQDQATDRNFNKEVRAIFQDSRKWIWTGNKRGEIVVYNQNMEKLFVFNDLPGLEKYTISTGIYAFEEDRHNRIWIGTKGDGIFVVKNLPASIAQFPGSRVQVVRLFYDPANPNGLSRNDVFDLHEDHTGQMWVGLYHGGLNVIVNPLEDNQKILYYRKNVNDRFSLSDDRVRCMFEDDQGNMWIGTAHGLNFLLKDYIGAENKKFLIIERNSGQGALSHNDIINITRDSENNIVICTYGGGINILKTEEKFPPFVFEQVKENDGLSNNLVLGAVEDEKKNLWLATDFGLCRYNRSDNIFENFFEPDGLQENSFSEGLGIITSSGLLAFGHISGMVWFHPDSIKKSERQVPVVMTDLLVNGRHDQEKLNTARRVLKDSIRHLKLRYDENFLTFEFAALDFTAPSKIQYSFKLGNYENEWTRSGNLNKAIYRNLKPGSYIFRLKASNSEGLWVNPELKLFLNISPPPWKTIWAYMGYFLFSLGLFFLIRKVVLDRIRLKHEVEFEKQLVDDKLKFYTSISHEFKTPLALILGPVEDMLAGGTLGPSIQGQLKMVKRNTHRLLELLSQLMDFRKIQKGFFRINSTRGDLVGFLYDIWQAFVPLSEQKQIDFTFNCEQQAFEILFDHKSLEKIVFNLLSNAFKHTGAGQRVELKLDVDFEGKRFFIIVTDEGEGIREEYLPHIFDRFSFGTRSRWSNEQGTGVGLSLTKELTELLGGKISVVSSPGAGSCFAVELPVPDGKNIPGETTDEAQGLEYTHRFIHSIEDENIPAPEKSPKKAMVSKETVLVVEDNTDMLNYLYNNLSAVYRVIRAVNGKEGFEQAKNENPDLIICDIMMPEMNGLELTRLLKNEFHTSHIPIILLTAKTLDEHRIEGIETGADDYIAKPFNMLYLQTRVANILKQRKQLKERFTRDLNIEPEELVQSSADREFIGKVMELIHDNMDNPEFSVDFMLKYFSFSRTVFYKKIKGITGYAPKDFILIPKMKKAAALLKEQKMTITEVAFEVGYSDTEHFRKTFKKHFGITPSEYKKNSHADSHDQVEIGC